MPKLSVFRVKNKSKTKKRILYLISLSVGLILFLSLLFHFNLKYDLSRNVLDLFAIKKNYRFLAIFLALSIIYYLISTYRWQTILKTYNINVKFFPLFKYFIAGNAISYLTPTNFGGEPIRVILVNNYFTKRSKLEPISYRYLNHKLYHSWKSFVDLAEPNQHIKLVYENSSNRDAEITTSVVLDKVISVSTNFFFLIFGLLFIIIFLKLSLLIRLILIFFTLFSSTILLLFFFTTTKSNLGIVTLISRKVKKLPILGLVYNKLERARWYYKVRAFIKRVEHLIGSFFSKHKKVVIKSFILSLLLCFLNLFMILLLVRMVSPSLSLMKLIALSYLTMVMISFLFVIPVPGAFGVHELFVSILFYSYGLNPSLGFIVASVVRIKDLLWSLLGLLYIYARGVLKVMSL